jgi:hypothetical protein
MNICLESNKVAKVNIVGSMAAVWRSHSISMTLFKVYCCFFMKMTIKTNIVALTSISSITPF